MIAGDLYDWNTVLVFSTIGLTLKYLVLWLLLGCGLVAIWCVGLSLPNNKSVGDDLLMACLRQATPKSCITESLLHSTSLISTWPIVLPLIFTLRSFDGLPCTTLCPFPLATEQIEKEKQNKCGIIWILK